MDSVKSVTRPNTETFRDIRKDARKTIAKIDRALALIDEERGAALKSCRQRRWALLNFIGIVLHDKKLILETVIKTYRVKKKRIRQENSNNTSAEA